MRFGKRVEASSWVIDGQKRACIRGEACEILSRQNTTKRKEATRTFVWSERAILSNRGRALECFRRCRL